MLSFAQNFEDVMLARLFEGQESGFYIDIGASDPDHFSVTRHFYDRNWRDINVEPIPEHFARLQRSRPRDINLRVAIDDHAGTRLFFESPGYDGLSTFDPAQAEYLRAQGFPITSYEVATLTGDQLFERHVVGVVDFLKIDVEGSEATVLRGLDLTRHRPRALLIESTPAGRPFAGWDRLPERDRSWEGSILAAGYDFAYFDGINSFYLRAEDRALARRLQLPPGVYDEIKWPEAVFQREATVQLNETIAQRDRVLAAAQTKATDLQQSVERLEHALESLKSDLLASNAKAEARRRARDESEAARAARNTDVANLQKSAVEQNAALAELAAQLRALQDRGFRARLRDFGGYTARRLTAIFRRRPMQR